MDFSFIGPMPISHMLHGPCPIYWAETGPLIYPPPVPAPRERQNQLHGGNGAVYSQSREINLKASELNGHTRQAAAAAAATCSALTLYHSFDSPILHFTPLVFINGPWVPPKLEFSSVLFTSILPILLRSRPPPVAVIPPCRNPPSTVSCFQIQGPFVFQPGVVGLAAVEPVDSAWVSSLLVEMRRLIEEGDGV